jgi:hypothetical protein
MLPRPVTATYVRLKGGIRSRRRHANQLAKQVPLGGALLRRIGLLLHAVALKPAAAARAPVVRSRETRPGVPSRI